MIVSLDNTLPDINLVDQYQRIIHYSKLSDIFDHADLEKAFKKENMKELLKQKEEKIVSSKQKYNKVIYVARGNCIEKCGELTDSKSRQIKLSKGEIAGL